MACSTNAQAVPRVLQCLQTLLEDLPQLFVEFERNFFNTNNEDILQSMHGRATALCSILSVLDADLADLNIERNLELFDNLHGAFQEICAEAHRYRTHFQDSFDHPLHRNSNNGTQFHLDNVVSGSVGRPKVHLSKEQVSVLISLGFKFTDISSMLGVHPKTLRKLRREWDLSVGQSVFTDITDEELDVRITAILHESPNSGERMMMGALLSQGIRVQRARLRDALQRLDPVGRSLRRRLKIRRRVYNVPCANYLWHADGHHKLIRWRMVIHWCIDGFSRLITYLWCSNNNTSDTVLGLFEEAVQKFRCPLRIRTDHGTENVRMAEWMLRRHGVDKNPVITGSSVHNQRIERLWVDLSSVVTAHYINLFSYMEQQMLLDPDNEIHLNAVQYVYIPKINHALKMFVDQWNNHPIRTARGHSPLQLWTRSFHEMAHCQDENGECLIERTMLVEQPAYGVDDESTRYSNKQ
eukprot:gene11470-12666_t